MSPLERNRVAEDYVAAFAKLGSRALIGNLATTVHLHHWGEHVMPLTINDGEPGETFVCAPRVGYIDYPLEELKHFPNRALAHVLQPVIQGVGGVLSMCDINRVVQINNWMMSTNLSLDLEPSLVKAQTAQLADSHPQHFLAIRSLTWRYDAVLMRALEATGWALLPSRQVFLIENVERDCMPRRDTKRDDRLWQRGTFTYEELANVNDVDAERIAELYVLLYLEKYSRLNPAYTPSFIKLTHAIGLIRYMVLRDQDGIIQAFGGMLHMGPHATMPLIGYDTHSDPQLGLYRLAIHTGTLFARRHGIHFNMSSGASSFKENRGAVAEMEFSAFYLRHLPKLRRYPFGLLQSVANKIGIPLLKRYHL